ncbi:MULTISPECIES: hypothetical protein [Xenorhabdus]|uniref:hypothetical protein n=1 Tax=Xenorhabdus TaxID=626 RepID=UPI00064A525A|nr:MULTISPECIES: hypothetical protein [Xenorhabdus]KLU16142.1 hypothetical protein AAY47_07205 [Xenorhabdus griffiniae]KOP33781.1 hypothetical protein AFK69_08130 [Xenorhabdus sp. GDc328]
MAAMITTLRKGVVLLLIIALVIVISLAIGWAGLHQAENITEMHHWVTETRGFWLVWRLCLYAVLGWGSRKIGQRTIHQPEYRATLIRVMVVSLLFIVLGEYALSGHLEGIA